jgi:hypothetical protein
LFTHQLEVHVECRYFDFVEQNKSHRGGSGDSTKAIADFEQNVYRFYTQDSAILLNPQRKQQNIAKQKIRH